MRNCYGWERDKHGNVTWFTYSGLESKIKYEGVIIMAYITLGIPLPKV